MQSPPICSNEQWEQKSEKDLTAYRFRYALGFLLYHTTRKMSNRSFRFFARTSIGYPQLSSKNRLDKSAKMRKKREPASTADDLLSRKRLCIKAKKTPDNAGDIFFCPRLGRITQR